MATTVQHSVVLGVLSSKTPGSNSVHATAMATTFHRNMPVLLALNHIVPKVIAIAKTSLAPHS